MVKNKIRVRGWFPERTMKSLCAVGGRLGWRKSFFFFPLARLTWGLHKKFAFCERHGGGPGRGLKVGLVGFW